MYSAYAAETDDAAYILSLGEEKTAWIQSAMARSVCPCNQIDPESAGKTVTFSTCHTNGKRCVVQEAAYTIVE